MEIKAKNWSEWLKKTRFSYMTEAQQDQTLAWLINVRDNILKMAEIKQSDTVIDIGSGTGLLGFGAYELIGDSGKVMITDVSQDCLDDCLAFATQSGLDLTRLSFKNLDASVMDLPDECVDVVLLRSVLVHILDKQKPINEFYRILSSGGSLNFYEPVISSNTRYYNLVNIHELDIADKIISAEEAVMTAQDNPLTNFSDISLKNMIKSARFSSIIIHPVVESSTYPVKEGMIDQWFTTPPSPGGKTMKELLLQNITESEFETYLGFLNARLIGTSVTINTQSIYCRAVKI